MDAASGWIAAHRGTGVRACLDDATVVFTYYAQALTKWREVPAMTQTLHEGGDVSKTLSFIATARHECEHTIEELIRVRNRADVDLPGSALADAMRIIVEEISTQLNRMIGGADILLVALRAKAS